MATTKKTDSGKPAAKQSAARKPAAKKAAAKKAGAAKKPAPKKAAVSVAVAPAKKVSAAKLKAKAERPVPEKVPGRKERRGVVVSDAMDKTIVVRIDVAQKHERYGKVVRRSSKLHAHDELNAAGIGDLVRLVETRPLSASKRWRLLEILEKAK
ncbi:MAG: 30S ribosomal protein S17 [Thermoleophilia bacterium]